MISSDKYVSEGTDKVTMFWSHNNPVADNVALSRVVDVTRLSLSSLVSKIGGDASRGGNDVDTDEEGVMVMGSWSPPTMSKSVVDVIQSRRPSSDL
jgi:hypothetical protein